MKDIIYGKSTQDGIPTPQKPVEIKRAIICPKCGSENIWLKGNLIPEKSFKAEVKYECKDCGWFENVEPAYDLVKEVKRAKESK